MKGAAFSAGTGWRSGAAAVCALAAIFWSQFRWVRVTNFGGYDEWLIVWLTSRGVVDFPYARRPLELVWDLPAPLLFPHRLAGFLIVHAAYLLVGGLLVYLLCRRLLPAHPRLAFLAAAFTLTWAPSDPVRIEVIESLAYAGVTVATLFAALLLVESWLRARPGGLAAGMVVGFGASLSYESVVPLLASAPVLLRPGAEAAAARRLRAWIWSWEAMVGVAAARIAWQLLGRGSYQGAMGLDPRPLAVLLRLRHQYGLHLLPLVTTPPAELATAAAVISALVFALAFFLTGREDGAAEPAPENRRLHARLVGVGLGLAGCGYGVFALSATITTAARTQFLSAPGIGLFLAAAACWIASWLPPRARPLALALIGAWIVGVGTGRVAALQREWDRTSFYPNQIRALRQLTDRVPDVRPHTLIVMIDEAGAWPATFAFRPAVEYLYQRRAAGFVAGAWPYLFPTAFAPDGIHTTPHPDVQDAWVCPPTIHRYDEVVVVRDSASRELQVLEEWPNDALPPLPAGAAYAPRGRILSGTNAPAERRILGTMR